MITIEKRYAENSRHYKNNTGINVKTLVLHSVGCPQPDPNVFARLWDDPDVKYLAHLVVGAEEAFEVIPCTKTKGKAVLCAHVGSANNYSIGVEMTEPSTIKYTSGGNWTDLNPEKTKAHVLKTYENAVEIFAQLCLFHGLDPLKDGAILSHKECHARGIGTNHGDPEHLWKKFGLTMSQFRKDVQSTMGQVNPESTETTTPTTIYRVQIGAFRNKDYAVELMNKAKSAGFEDCFIVEQTLAPIETPKTPVIKVGSKVKVKQGAKTYTGGSIASFVYDGVYTVDELKGDRAVLDKKGIYSAFNVKDLILQ